jgi:RNA polymerase sigma-70 factor (ECF subfamily)
VIFTTIDDTRIDDASLIQQLALNNKDALSALYDRYGRLVYSIAFNSVGDQAAAEEIVQDVFTRIWQKANTYDAGIAKVSTWLISITRNRVIDELRREKAHPERTAVGWFEESEIDSSSSLMFEEETELSWRQKLVKEALNTLSPHDREVLALAYFKGYSQSKIAEVLGIPLGTAKTRIRSAMQKLHRALSQSIQEDQ